MVTTKARIAWFGHSNRAVSNAGCGHCSLNPWGWVVFSTPLRYSVAHVKKPQVTTDALRVEKYDPAVAFQIVLTGPIPTGGMRWVYW